MATLQELIDMSRMSLLIFQDNVFRQDGLVCIEEKTFDKMMDSFQQTLSALVNYYEGIHKAFEAEDNHIEAHYFCGECGSSFDEGTLMKRWLEFCRTTPEAKPDIDPDEVPFCPNCLHDW